MKKNIFIFTLTIISMMIWARDKRVSSYNELYDQLSRTPYAAVLLYDASREVMKDKKMRQYNKELEIMFKSLSDNPEYKEADLLFMRADISKSSLQPLMKEWNILSLPVIQLFEGRTLLPGARLYGKNVDRQHIDLIIEKYLRKKIEEIIKEKAKARQRALEQAKIRAYNQAIWGPYWYGGYYGYPYYAPYYGPYYRGYYGPGYGFYFGW